MYPAKLVAYLGGDFTPPIHPLSLWVRFTVRSTSFPSNQYPYPVSQLIPSGCTKSSFIRKTIRGRSHLSFQDPILSLLTDRLSTGTPHLHFRHEEARLPWVYGTPLHLRSCQRFILPYFTWDFRLRLVIQWTSSSILLRETQSSRKNNRRWTSVVWKESSWRLERAFIA
jgi:hypothetical protein